MTTTRATYVALALMAGGGAMLPWAPALADSNWKQNSYKWGLMDKCTRAARKQYPDHTVEASAKREAARRQCLMANNLPTNDSQEPETDPGPDRR